MTIEHYFFAKSLGFHSLKSKANWKASFFTLEVFLSENVQDVHWLYNLISYSLNISWSSKNTDTWILIYIGIDFDCNTCDIAFWFELVSFIANLTIVVWKTITCNLLPFERNRRKITNIIYIHTKQYHNVCLYAICFSYFLYIQ